MIFELGTSLLLGGVAASAFVAQKGITVNDSGKIQRIMSLSGLNVKDGKDTLTTQLMSKKQHDWGWEYKYRIPLGRSFNDYLAKQDVIQDGLNNRKKTPTLNEIKQIAFKKDYFKNLQELQKKKLGEQKEIEIAYDGLLIIRVYEQPLPKEVPFTQGQLWKVPVGITREMNEFKYHDFEKVPHFVLGGATRYGKSNFINSLIVSLLQSQPEYVHYFLIDLKGGVELCDYENIKQTESIAYEPEEALETLEKAYKKMREVQSRLRRIGQKNVQQANIRDRYFIIIDEVGELNPQEAVTKVEKELKYKCQTILSQIARLGAGLGFRLVVATQYPTGDVIPRQVKQNSDAKLSFRVQSATASRVVLDESGAELLPQIRGRAIYQTADKRTILQTPLITSETIQNTIKPFIIEKVVRDDYKEKVNSERRENTVTFEEI